MKQKLSIYFIHAKYLAVRRGICDELLNKLGKSFDVTSIYIDTFEPSDINHQHIKDYVNLKIPETKDIFDTLIKNIHIKQFSNTLKHFEAYKQIAKTNDGYHLILEDDILYGENIDDQLQSAIENIKQLDDWNLIFTGLPQLSNTKIQKNIIPVQDLFKIIPSCESYFVNVKYAQKLVESFLPIRFQTTVQLSYLFTHKDIKSFMTIPSIFVDGSKYGAYMSSLDSNNKLFYNIDYNKLLAIVSKSNYTNDDHNQIAEIKKTIKFNTHPDILYQFALYEMKRQNFNISKQLFETVLSTYQKNECIINNQSEFLTSYCQLFGYLQDI